MSIQNNIYVRTTHYAVCSDECILSFSHRFNQFYLSIRCQFTEILLKKISATKSEVSLCIPQMNEYIVVFAFQNLKGLPLFVLTCFKLTDKAQYR